MTNKLERYLQNISEEAKDQALRFLLEPKDAEETIDNKGFILLCVEQFSRMYPRGD